MLAVTGAATVTKPGDREHADREHTRSAPGPPLASAAACQGRRSPAVARLDLPFAFP
jgi:hypothetical protein